jgi:hypothetical protein
MVNVVDIAFSQRQGHADLPELFSFGTQAHNALKQFWILRPANEWHKAPHSHQAHVTHKQAKAR